MQQRHFPTTPRHDAAVQRHAPTEPGRRLADIWPGGKHVVTEYGEKFPDRSVWAEARAHGYTIITKDSDFSDAEKYAGPPPQVVRLTIGNATPADLEAYLREHAAEIEAFAASGERHRDI